MTALGHVGGFYEVICGHGAKDDALEETRTNRFYYVAKAGRLAEEEVWGPAKDRAFAFAEAMRQKGWRCRVFHHVTHLIDNGKSTTK